MLNTQIIKISEILIILLRISLLHHFPKPAFKEKHKYRNNCKEDKHICAPAIYFPVFINQICRANGH